MKKQALIIFIEGQDRCGKSSLIKPLFDELDKIHNIIDRGLMSNYVYSKEYNREVDLNSYLDILKKPEIVTIYLDPSEDEIKNRTEKSNDYNVPLNEIHHHKQIWNEAYLQMKDYENVFKIDNTNLSILETVEKIKKLIKRYEVYYETIKRQICKWI